MLNANRQTWRVAVTIHAAGAHHDDHFANAEARIDTMSAILAQNWWAVAVRGVAAILFGIVALLLPGAALLALILLFAAFALVDGVFAIVSAVRAARQHERWALLVFEGVVDLIAAAVALLLPIVAAVGFVLVVAAWSLVTGVLAIGATFRLRRDHGQIWMALGGIVSVLLGVLLAIAPLIGAVVLTWWIGAYALIAGISLCILAFRLRAHRPDRGPSNVAAAT